MERPAPPCTVRPAGHGDLLAVLGVYARRGPGGVVPSAATPLEERTWAEMCGRDGLTVYLADAADGTGPVGTATLLTMPNLNYGCAPTAFLEAVVVAHDHRRRGVATAVLCRALDDARAAGCDKVQLLSHRRHATDGAHALYRGLGFEPEAEGFRRYLRSAPRR